MTAAKALWFESSRRADLRVEEVPNPGPGQVQVSAICALVSAGSELNLYRGEANLPDLSMFPTADGRLPFPVKFGYQEVGEVVATGTGAALSVGDRVLCLHPHQSLFNLDAPLASRVPADLEPERAALLTLTRVAISALLTTPTLIGDCVAVSGLGVVGSLISRSARLTADRLILIDPSASRRTLANWIGADAVIGPEEASAAVEDLTDGRGVDLFLEASGASAALQTAVELTAMEGTISVPAWYGTRQVSLSLSPEFHLRRQHIVSSGPGVPPELTPRWNRDRIHKVAWGHIREIGIEKHLITHRVPFDRAPEAYQLLDNPESGALGVLLEH